jgi:beta-lactamase superfamily II metal-dependent hydrolase
MSNNTDSNVNNTTDKVTDRVTDKATDKETEALPANSYVLFQNGAYTIKAIMPDKPTDIENTVYAKLRSKIKSKTGRTLTTNTDYLKTGETHSATEPEILVGLTNYSQSQNTYSGITNGQYGIKFSGQKIIFYFSTVEEGLELVEEFCSAIKSTADKAFYISKSFSVSKNLSFKLESVPKYPTSTTSYNCYDDTTMLIAKSTNLTNYNSYCNTLKSNGFTEYSVRDNVNGNYFRTYTKGTTAVTVYFNKSNNTVRIISGPLTDIPPKNTTSYKENNSKPSVTLLNQGTKSNGTQQGSGLGIIFYLPNGKFIIYDGGYTANDGLYKKLKELAGTNEIIIAAWIISHPHADHQDAFDAFLKNHAKDIEIETVMYNYTSLEDQYGSSATIRSSVNTYLNGKTTIIKPHTGQIYKFGSSSVEILHTVEDLMPISSSFSDPINNSSMVVRVTVSGKTVILLGDALKETANILTNTYGSYLKADMVQLGHHGSWPGTETLYSNINAPVVFWPSSADNAKNRYKASDHASLRKAISLAKDVYLASEGSATLTLPYTIVNNKSAFLKRLGV